MPAAIVLVALVVAGLIGAVPFDDRVTHRETPGHRAEVARIQRHFDSVLAVLPSRDVGHLTGEQRAKRQAVLATLREYRDAGVFPHNHDFGRTPTPYFIDRKSGTLCAVAYLMASTGRRDIAERVAAMDNNVWVAQLAPDTAFAAWLDLHGLTLDEAAWIQVPYVEDWGTESPTPTARTPYGAVSLSSTAAATTLTLVNAFTNRDGHGRARGILGLALGGASLGVAVVGARSDAPNSFVAANAISGVTSLVLSANGFFTQRRIAADRRSAESSRVATTVVPILPVDGSGPGAGVSVAVRF